MKKTADIVAILAFLGIIITVYLLFQHYKTPGESFCNVSEFVSCDVVNKSVYSEIFGIPVAAFGLLAYIIIFIGALCLRKNHNKRLALGLTAFAALGLLFSLALTYIEFFVLYAVCIFCVTQQIIILLIFIILLRLCITQKCFSRL